MAAMHTTMIRASMTAYSTAVGPSSRRRKFATFSANLRMALMPFIAAPRSADPYMRTLHGALPTCPRPDATGLRRATDRVADGGEGLVGVGAQGGDGRDAHDDDQGQHDRVLDGRRAIFTLQE